MLINRGINIRYIVLLIVVATICLSQGCSSKQENVKAKSGESIDERQNLDDEKDYAEQRKESQEKRAQTTATQTRIDERMSFARTLEDALNKKGYNCKIKCYGADKNVLQLHWPLVDESTAQEFMDKNTIAYLKSWGFDAAEFYNDGVLVSSYYGLLKPKSRVGSTKQIQKQTIPRITKAAKKRKDFADYLNQNMGTEATIVAKGDKYDILYYETSIMTSDYAGQLYLGSRELLTQYGFRFVHYSNGYGLDRTYDL